MKVRTLFSLSLIMGTALTVTIAAQAHISLEQSTAVAGKSYKAILKIPHGCGNQPTVKVRTVLPEGFYAAQPQAKAGWNIAAIKGDYENSYTSHGKELNSGIKEITWSDGELPSDLFDEFIITGEIAPFKQEASLAFNTYQSCANGDEIAWDQVSSANHSQHSTEYPAPVLHVLALATADVPAPTKSPDNHSDHGAQHKSDIIVIGDLDITAPQIRAMIPGAKVAGGYMNIKNNGNQADRLLSVTSPDAARIEIHEMSMENDVMKMRQIPEGLPLPAGETTELKSGGYHLMFMKPVRIFAEGESVPAVLEFEKAGKIELNFIVTNTKGQASEHNHH